MLLIVCLLCVCLCVCVCVWRVTTNAQAPLKYRRHNFFYEMITFVEE
jgi:hypothetical protein